MGVSDARHGRGEVRADSDQGSALIEAGRKAVASGSMPRMIAADMKFHAFIHDHSANPLVAPTLAPHLVYMQRVMGQVLQQPHQSDDIWDQHAALLAAVANGQPDLAESLARRHIQEAAEIMIAGLAADGAGSTAAAA